LPRPRQEKPEPSRKPSFSARLTVSDREVSEGEGFRADVGQPRLRGEALIAGDVLPTTK
jgi:hypothetical protein